jgi:hypothetical protein
MSTELLGLIGMVLWSMVLIAQWRKKSASGSVKNLSSRRNKLRHNRY